MSRIAVVDADGHVTEPMSLWTDYVEPAYRERAPRPVLDERGRPCMLLDGRLVMRHAMLLTLGPDYDVGAALKEQAVNELRSRSPLPIRTDADAILGRAVDDFFERRFAEDAAAYCDRLRARLEGHAS